MTPIGSPPRTPQAWDVPTAAVAFNALKAQARTAGLAAEDRHLLDPLDNAFAQLAAAHPDTCTTDYHGWTPGGHA